MTAVRIALLRTAVGLTVGLAVVSAAWFGAPMAHVTLVADAVRTGSGADLTWFVGGRLSNAGNAAVQALRTADEHGLDPAWYDALRVDSLARTIAQSPVTVRAAFDSALTASMRQLLHDLRYGRVKSNPFRAADSSGSDTAMIAAALDDAVRGDSIQGLVRAMQPAFAEYDALRGALARYRAMAAESGLALDTARFPVHVGDTTLDAALLRHRLQLLGDMPRSIVAGSLVYDSALSAAMARFQARHGLTADGVLGRETAAALAVPLAHRVRQLELALERVRWLPRGTDPQMVMVNIATYRLRAFESMPVGASPAFATRVIVGTARRTPTPMLRGALRSVDFRPYWNVPRAILVNEILPAIRRNPDYLRANDMEAVRGEQVIGDSVTAELMEQLASGAARVRQRPGPRNALGLVRFDFPNDSTVYLHDTPQRDLFARARRDFSHGCIRVEHADALARWVLRAVPGWAAPDSVARAMAGPASRRMPVPGPIPIVLEYRTATIGPEGEAWFFPDIYGRDSVIARTLATSAGVVERPTEPGSRRR